MENETCVYFLSLLNYVFFFLKHSILLIILGMSHNAILITLTSQFSQVYSHPCDLTPSLPPRKRRNEKKEK